MAHYDDINASDQNTELGRFFFIINIGWCDTRSMHLGDNHIHYRKILCFNLAILII